MSSWFQLTLDTHAPVVTFGAPDSSGGALSIPYTIDEPSIASAWVVDSAGLRVDLAVEPSRLYGVLPGTVTAGWATVTAHAVDAVGNAHDYTLAVMLAGAAPAPEPTGPPPSRPSPIAPRPRKFVRSRVVVRQACPATVRTSTSGDRSTLTPRSRATTAAVVRTSAALPVASAATTRARVTARETTRGHAALSNVELRRGVGRSVEEALLLDLL